MNEFKPVNSLEIKLRALMQDKSTPVWSFYTPLAAAELWVITKNHPELDGSDRVAPEGQNPKILSFNEAGSDRTIIALYTAPSRVRQAMKLFKLSTVDFIFPNAPGYQLLKLISTIEGEIDIVMNLGIPECQYRLDPDLVEILLERPEPEYEADRKPEATNQPQRRSTPVSDEYAAPRRHLGPLREFLSRQPNVRAAWILIVTDDPSVPAGLTAYEVGIVMEDPEDESLLGQVKTMAKALTPVEMEWQAMVLMADDQSYRNLSKNHRPFYAAKDFLAGK